MDQQEFADRTEAIKTRLYRTAYLYLGSEADALEAVDETVYRALRRLKQLQTPALFETWITRIYETLSGSFQSLFFVSRLTFSVRNVSHIHCNLTRRADRCRWWSCLRL